ncbi:MAG: hypothetical protein A3C35_04285 [Omnitrophica bacterium RIFCSPHIGHO2_02_FULL_46_11]|nr:MAG: hypothetical protein A3C35_04285 [Omnitrophica bacterium RIFCSPHIGHO2_02_FULL_46_11]
MIYIGADHRGYAIKEQLKEYLTGRGYQLTDVGTDSEESVDYPLIAKKVAEEVRADPNNRGVLLCGSGVGVCIVANKFKGIRAGEVWNASLAQKARTDDNINVLCLSADTVSLEDAKKIAQTFLDTSFAGEERYKRRLKQIEEIEKEN